MGQLRVEAASEADAACLCKALAGNTISHSGERWVVSLALTGFGDLGRLLDALQTCLNEAAIASVTVSIDEARYVMEAAP
jgi:hypothetical protein